MKKTILYVAIACAVSSCGNNGANQAELIQATKTADSLKAAIAQQNTIDSMNAVSAANNKGGSGEHRTYEHHEHDANNANNGNNNNNNNGGGAPPPPPPQQTVTNAPANTPAPVIVNAAPQTPVAPAAAAPTAKKGMSAKAEGALIGAGAGAIGGALIDSKKKGQAVKGGIIGGVVGAAAGFGAGALIDHKKKKDTTGN